MPAAPLKPLICLPPLHFQVIIKYYRCLGSNVKEIDDTDLPESESEWDLDAMFDSIAYQIRWLNKRIASLEKRERRVTHELTLRIANLETQRSPQDENDDPEWFS